MTVWDGDHAMLVYPKPFQSPPRLVIVEFRESQSPTRPYARSDLQVVRQTATYFTLFNHHGDQSPSSWATVKWRATGVLAPEPPTGKEAPAALAAQDNKARQALFLARVQKAGGAVTLNPRLPDKPVVGIDLHQAGATDADMEELSGFTQLRSLNLYGARVTDAGLRHLSGLTSLQTLYLNDTGVTDAGLQHLKGLTQLKVLGLNQTHVTDAGLAALGNLKTLTDLTLSGGQITDRGLLQLRTQRSLKHLLLNGTSVTQRGVDELKRAIPDVQIIRAK